ncbi:hypothetical protein MM221_07965 [Salipaludibacillus sp. LMS25]|jgi:16S rRNA A1518/A1519 N6-dimethyltransferase RsmA/KsgA/DIM1 with predicted DNA glycosylase/AP lyase activity|uniref:hypothetical protein n=1 Tax=Salipaludibacillus sp. LMS25 TaxID=2924031 RepID=UPI0020D0F718|nr:hypothetical protein [Salipaludibacillus sp. LMS25]UTR16466.1 hypothetical protein MM221_07965 [Salipaludibacillus sp. LMS25]
MDKNESFQYDTSTERQRGVMNIILEDIKKMGKLCEKCNREMPTEKKLIYNAADNSLKADYRYDMVYSNDPHKVGSDIFLEWFEEVNSNM